MNDIERIASETELSVDAVIPKNNAWLCPVCSIKRNIGNHKRCSKITQLKHQKERELSDKTNEDLGQKSRNTG